MKLRSLLSIIVVTFLFLAGCQWGNNDTDRDRRTPVDETRNTRDGQMTNDRLTQNVENKNRFRTNDRRGTDREHDRFEVSGEAAERIVEEVEEIGQAYVLTSKKNAYVAATLRENDRSPGDRSDANLRERRGTINDGNNRGTTNNSNNGSGMNEGINDNVRADDRTKDERPSAGDATNFRDTDQNVQNRNSRGDELSEDVKKRISDIVKDTDKNIDNVYVSTSPDFFNLSNDFADDAQNGHPVEGFFDQIGNMIERVFPQNQR